MLLTGDLIDGRKAADWGLGQVVAEADLDDAVDNAVSDFWKELEELENGEVHRSLSGPM